MNINRTKRDQERCEQMLVEFVDAGGLLDGGQLHLDVVVESPTRIRVLEQSYTRRAPVLKASEVEAGR